MSLVDLLREELDLEVEATRTLLERIPEGQWDWKPHEKSMNLSRLATHVAEIPIWSNSILGADEFDFLSPEMQEWQPREMQSAAEILAELEASAEICRGELAKMTDGALQETWTMRAGDQVLMAEPRYMVFRRQVLNHLVHHRGQLEVYFRMLDAPLPMIYGPTADESGDMGDPGPE
jgi:uncharacterized damage-inducible protein DinB